MKTSDYSAARLTPSTTATSTSPEPSPTKSDSTPSSSCPQATPTTKDPSRASAQDRLIMTELAIADDPRFAASDCDIVRDGATYTFNTVQIFRQQFPAAQLWWLMGSDSLMKLHTWKKMADPRAPNPHRRRHAPRRQPQPNPARTPCLAGRSPPKRQRPHLQRPPAQHLLHPNPPNPPKRQTFRRPPAPSRPLHPRTQTVPKRKIA